MRLLVTYLEMLRRPDVMSACCRPNGTDIQREQLGVTDYLALYRAVGGSVCWDQRLRLKRDELERLLACDWLHLLVLRVAGDAVGLCEFEARDAVDVELTNFGIVPEVQGQGLGLFLLEQALRFIWDKKPSRVWLRTDTNDHPRALPLYLQVGFRPFKQRMEDFHD